MKNINSLSEVIKSALLTALVGLASGLVFGLLIWTILYFISGTGSTEMPPLEIAAFLGMGVGTVLGAIFGGLIALKK